MKMKNIWAMVFAIAIVAVLFTGFGKASPENVEFLFDSCMDNPSEKCSEIYKEYSIGNMVHFGILIILSVTFIILIFSIALETISDSSNNKLKLKLMKLLFTEEEEKSYENYVQTSSVKFRKKSENIELKNNHFYYTTFKRFSPDVVNEEGIVNAKQLEHISNLSSMNEGRYIWVYSKVLMNNKIKYVLDFCLVD